VLSHARRTVAMLTLASISRITSAPLLRVAALTAATTAALPSLWSTATSAPESSTACDVLPVMCSVAKGSGGGEERPLKGNLWGRDVLKERD